MLKQFQINLFILSFIIFNSCKEKKQSLIAPGSPGSLVVSIFSSLQNKPSFSPEGGSFDKEQIITIQNSKGNNIPIRYTLDGRKPTCIVGDVYDREKKITIKTGKFTLQAVECFEGISLDSSIQKGDYSITGTFSYNEELNDEIALFPQINHIIKPVGLDSSITYTFSVTPNLNSCLSLDSSTGIITETCTSDISDTEYTFTATSNSSPKTDFINKVRIGGSWGFEQEAYLKPPNINDPGGNAEFFGQAVSVSGDTIVVGVKEERSNRASIINGSIVPIDNFSTGIGAAYVFRRKGNTWVHESYLKASNSIDGAQRKFGTSVGVSSDTIVVGTPGDFSNQTTITNGTTSSGDTTAGGAGAVFVYRRNGVNWAQEAYIKASNAETSDSFGDSVSIFGDTIAVGATGEDSDQTTITNGTTSASDNTPDINAEIGAVYVYRRNGVNWTQEAYIKASNSIAGLKFGNRVRLTENTLVVSSTVESSNQTTITNGTTAPPNTGMTPHLAGAVYVYKRNGNIWTQEAHIKASNPDRADSFGEAIGIFEDTIVVGASGEDSNQTTITNGTTSSLINTSNPNTANLLTGNQGAVYVYRRTGTTWVQEAYIKAVNSDVTDRFGSQVDVHGNTIVVGAQNEDSAQTTITNGTTAATDNTPNININNGSAYVYRRSGSSWYQIAYIKGVNLGSGTTNLFGSSVGIFEDRIVVGASSEDSSQTTITNGTTAPPNTGAANSGAAYVYRLRKF